MKLYASKIADDSIIKLIIKEYALPFSYPEETKKIPKVCVELETPPYNASDSWLHQLKGSFIEYLIGHLIGASNMESEINDCEKSNKLSEEHISLMRNSYKKISKNRKSANVLKELLLVSLSHYFRNSNGFNSEILDFYNEKAKNPVSISKENMLNLSDQLSEYSNFDVSSCESVSTDNIGGEMDFLAIGKSGLFSYKSPEIHILDAKFRAKDTDFDQLFIYASLLYITRGIRATHLVLINPKTGNIKKKQMKLGFYSKCKEMISKIVTQKISTSALVTKNVVKKTQATKKVGNKNLKPKVVRKSVRESDMSWPTWISYKLLG